MAARPRLGRLQWVMYMFAASREEEDCPPATVGPCITVIKHRATKKSRRLYSGAFEQGASSLEIAFVKHYAVHFVQPRKVS